MKLTTMDEVHPILVDIHDSQHHLNPRSAQSNIELRVSVMKGCSLLRFVNYVGPKSSLLDAL